MSREVVILIAEAMAVYFLVLGAHSLRRRFGLAHFYALIGGITAIMSWITDAGVRVDVAGISFMIGSTVFYTSLLLGVFVVYVFDGPRATRIAISTIAGVSIMVPVVAVILHFQAQLAGHGALDYVPIPSLRINTASVLTTIADLIFLAIAWEFLGKPGFYLPLWARAFLTLLCVMWLDVLLFSTGAFAGDPAWLGIMTGTLVSRFIISVFAFPFLYVYLSWLKNHAGMTIENRPVLAILLEVSEIRKELSLAQQEIERRKKAEREKEEVIVQLRQALAEVKTLRGFLPICAHCRKIRDDEGYWRQLEEYIIRHSEARFSHGICPECVMRHYPRYADEIEEKRRAEDRENGNSG
jgi:uncharacterized PurR-regulated membrane protein YhhQ (DUF165 family)